ncbi:MAG: hypothetical protein LC104_15500 [Bacteroidales bacterium]|nr:hypothetical protein [Bacteroidales bacterium]
MDTDQLASWLGLPPGHWPPEDRALLGFGSEPVDAAQIEARTLALMDKLRPYQLLHPELVTEGMNRLAQAMLTLSVAPAASATRDLPTESLSSVMPAERYAFAKEEPPPPVPPAPVSDQEMVIEPAFSEEVLDFFSSSLPRTPEPPLRFTGLESVTHPLAGTLTNRRELYRTLIALRRLRRAWVGLRESVADPTALLDTPAAVCTFLEQCARLRALALWRGRDPLWPAFAGHMVWSIVTLPTPLVVFRSLMPMQRETLARDWTAGLQALTQQQELYRQHLRATRPPRRRTRPIVRMEWVLLALSLLAVLLALLRNHGGNATGTGLAS